VEVVLAEDLLEAVELGLGVLGSVLLERLADAAREAAGESDQARRGLLEQFPVGARVVGVALEGAEAGELDQVAVAGVVLREEREVRVPLPLRASVVCDIDLAADD